jgi:anionic cell wall polymer biosynthesis LytR-Cps2A-Psr (LCP) family protein
MRLLARTLQQVVLARVDGSVIVDFDGFRDLVDALGGLEVDVPRAIDDDFVGEDGRRFSAHFATGPQRLDGEAALTYARTRKADGDSWRRQRHLDLVHATLRAARGIRSPRRAAQVATAAVRAVRTDLGMFRGLVALAGVLRAGRRGIEGVQLAPPVVRSVRTDEGKWVHRGDRFEIADFARRHWIDAKPDAPDSATGAPVR